MKQYQRARRSTNRRGSFSMHLHNAMQKEVDCRAVWKKTDIYRCNADHELTLIKNDPEGQKDVWLEIFGLSAADGFTVEVGTYKQDDKPFHYWEICHKGRVFIQLVPYQGTDDYVLSEMWVCIGTAKIDWYYNNVFDLQIFIFDNNLVVAYVSGNIQNAIDKGMIIIPPNDTALEFGQIRYDMYSIGISLEGILGAIDFHGGRGTNVTAPQKTLYEYFQDAIMTSPSTPTRKTRDNGTLVLRDFSIYRRHQHIHLREMWQEIHNVWL